MITDVGIDFDGVLYDFAGAFHEYCKMRMDKDLPAPAKWDFFTEWGMDESMFNQWLTEATVDVRIFTWNGPMPNVIEGWNKLKSLGVRMHVLTHRGHNAYEQSTRWLNRYGLYPDSLHFTFDKQILAHLKKDEAAAIDDYPYYYDLYEKCGVKAFLQTHPWNADKDARRVNDLLDFANKVEIYNEYNTIYKKPESKPVLKTKLIYQPDIQKPDFIKKKFNYYEPYTKTKSEHELDFPTIWRNNNDKA